MSYRDDLDAAHHRADALERELALARRDPVAIDRRERVHWPGLMGPLIGTAVSAGLTVAAFAVGVGTGWLVVAVGVTVLCLFAVIGSGAPPMPDGAVPVAFDLDLAGEGGGEARRLRVLAVVKLASDGEARARASERFNGRSLGAVLAAAAIGLEQAVRADPDASEATLRRAAETRLDAVGIVLDTFSVSAR